jgi:hypothetical protein
MADPLKLNLSITPDEQIPIEHLYAEREKALREEQWNALITPAGGETTAINATDEGLAKSADAAAAGPGRRLTPNAESTSEQVRARAEAQRVFREQTPVAAEIIARVLGFGTAAAASEKLARGDFGLSDAMKMTDLAGNTAEVTAQAEAKRAGLPDDLAVQIGSATGLLAGVLMPGGKGKGPRRQRTRRRG